MKIYQGYRSTSMGAFDFLGMHKLRGYNVIEEPLVVFGCYSNSDVSIINNHKSVIVVQWEGLDSKLQKDFSVFKNKNIMHVSPHPNIVKYFSSIGVTCHLINWVCNETIHPQILGNMVYSYVNKRNPKYYGGKVINKIKTKYELLIADYTLPTSVFPKDSYYSKAFLGLQLCNYAGGGFGIVEMGLRGIKVVTNVLDLPHTIKWNSVADIEVAINEESKSIGSINRELAEQVYETVLCPEKLKCYDLDQLLVK